MLSVTALTPNRGTYDFFHLFRCPLLRQCPHPTLRAREAATTAARDDVHAKATKDLFRLAFSFRITVSSIVSRHAFGIRA
jgi:hypothetical protein